MEKNVSIKRITLMTYLILEGVDFYLSNPPCTVTFWWWWWGIRQSSSTFSFLFTFLLSSSIISPIPMLYLSVYNLFALIERKVPITHSLYLSKARETEVR